MSDFQNLSFLSEEIKNVQNMTKSRTLRDDSKYLFFLTQQKTSPKGPRSNKI